MGSLKCIHSLTETGLRTRNKLRELEKFKVFNMLTLKYPREQSNCFSNNEVKGQTRLETSNFQIFKWTQVLLELRPRKDMYNYAKNEQKRMHKMQFSSKNLVMETPKKLIFLRIINKLRELVKLKVHKKLNSKHLSDQTCCKKVLKIEHLNEYRCVAETYENKRYRTYPRGQIGTKWDKIP